MEPHLARIFYLGKEYHGSQWQPNVRTIHGELIEALTNWSGKEYSVEMISFSGRTDKGVNSFGQVVQFNSDKAVNIDKINKYLPNDIVLWAHVKSPSKFNPRFGILSRHYRYYLDITKLRLDFDMIRKSARNLIGTNDFSLLSKPDGDRKAITTLLNVIITPKGSNLVFDFFGTRFLWKQVRKTITLLTSIGRGEIPPETVQLLLGGNSVLPGGIEPAPPEGLVLIEALVPFRMQISKNALARVKKALRIEQDYHRRVLSLVEGMNSELDSNEIRSS